MNPNRCWFKIPQFGRRIPAGIFLLVLLCYPSFSIAQSPTLIDQARKEGEVVLYTTMNVRDFAVFNQVAKEKYPFLNIRHVYLASSRQAAKVMEEHLAGQLQADVLGNSFEAMRYYQRQGIIGSYQSPESKYMTKGTVDPEGFWEGITTDLLISAYNTNIMTREAAPKDYEDYLKPAFKGQMAINSGVPYGLTGMIVLKGEEAGIAYMKRLGQQDLRPVEGFSHVANLLAAGEFPLAIFMQVSKIEALKKKGAPVDWVPSSPTFATISTIAIAKAPPHPAAARLLVDFYLSPEGQRALATVGKIPLRRGIKSPSKAIDDLLESENLYVVKPEGDFNRYMKLYKKFIGME
jgi:iron(III) transport system substrate-binding protein